MSRSWALSARATPMSTNQGAPLLSRAMALTCVAAEKTVRLISSVSPRPKPAPMVGTRGGAKLRALREGAGRTQLWVEAEAGLGTGYLQRVESGRVAQPERATLERILLALEARYSERREVLELFGYMVTTPSPTEEEVAWACDVCQRELHEVPFPAYVLDCMHRLIVWNHYVPRLFGVAPDDPR